MFWKILTLAVIVAFTWWRVRRFLQMHRARARGELPSETREGIRPISLLAAVLIAGYGGYLLWVIVRQALAAP